MTKNVLDLIKIITVDNLLNLKIADDEKTCLCCSSSLSNVIYTPCGHQVTCFECLGKMLTDKKCIMCRQKYEHVLHTVL